VSADRPPIAWSPPPDAWSATNVGRFSSERGVRDLHELRARSISEPDWFWGELAGWLGVPWHTPYEAVIDVSDGIPWAKWFVGGTLNAAELCVTRHARTAPTRTAPTPPAVVWEGEDGEVRRWSYEELAGEVGRAAVLLAGRGIGPGDAVGIFLPMVPEAVAALMAVASLGATFLPLFSGYAPEAIALRLADAGAKALVTADGFLRRGQPIEMLEVARRAADQVPSVETMVVVPRLSPAGHPTSHPTGGDQRLVPWAAADTGTCAPTPVDSEHILFIAYTSGTTGRPKGSVHVHGGFSIKVAEEAAMQFDVRPGDTLFWFTDMGWIMGPWEVFGALANGATLALYEGAPDWPAPDRLWAYVERHRVSVLGISPTLVRTLMAHGGGPVRAHDLSSLRILGSTGEPWNLDPWWWYFEVVGERRCPVINISGGTEVGACFLSPHPVEPLKPMTLGGPSLGMAVDVFDESGRPVRGAVGELVCTRPWPGMTRGLYKSADRYIETYWSRFPGVWTHGDWASVDEDGSWFLHGRSDDTIKVAGKRLGPAEAESVVVSHPSVAEAAAVGVPDPVKGEALWVFAVLSPGVSPNEQLREELADVVANGLGRAFRPRAVRFTNALPKTRNAKVLRRAIRAVVTGADPGDLSSLEDPSAIDAIRQAS